MFDLSTEAAAVAGEEWPFWQDLRNCTVLITGATGLIGAACARVLMERNRVADAGIRVVCLARSAEKARNVLDGYGEGDGLAVVEGDLTSDLSDAYPDYIIHAACPTASSFFVERPVETADAIVAGTRAMLQLAREAAVRGLVYASSMEVYGRGNAKPGLDHLLTESETGFMDPLQVRSSYSEGKRMAEQYCVAFAAEYGVPAFIVRLAQTFGPGVAPDDKRLFAQCVRAALAGEDIVLHTTGQSTRMYLYTMDAVTAILTVLAKGEPGKAYNAANPATYSSVVQLAETAAALNEAGETQVRCEVDPNAPFPPEHHLPLDVSRLTALEWRPTADLPQMLARLSDVMRIARSGPQSFSVLPASK